MVSSRNFGNMAVWSPKKGPLVCIEPWTTVPDGYLGEFAEGGVRKLEKGQKDICRAEYEFLWLYK